MSAHHDYKMFHDFIAKYNEQGFLNIDRQDPFMIDMEQKLKENNQFFYIADLMQVKLLFTSEGSQEIIGIPQESVNPYTFFEFAHPEDQEQLNRAQTKLYQEGQELFNRRKEMFIVSVQIKESNNAGQYIDLLLQTFSFYSEVPGKTVYTMIVATELSGVKINKGQYHYYAGSDLSMFRYPDEALLKEGHEFSARELQILQLISEGKGSWQIADKLSLSVNTVNTHRRNILKKSKKTTTQDLVIELQHKGLL